MCRPGSPTAPPDLTEPRGVTTEAPFIDHRVGVGRSCEHNGLKGNTCMPLQPRAFLGGTCGEAREAGEEQERRWERRPLQHRHTRLAAWPWARSCLQPAQETGGGPLDEAAAQGPALGAAAALRVSQPWGGAHPAPEDYWESLREHRVPPLQLHVARPGREWAWREGMCGEGRTCYPWEVTAVHPVS